MLLHLVTLVVHNYLSHLLVEVNSISIIQAQPNILVQILHRVTMSVLSTFKVNNLKCYFRVYQSGEI